MSVGNQKENMSRIKKKIKSKLQIQKSKSHKNYFKSTEKERKKQDKINCRHKANSKICYTKSEWTKFFY